MRQPLSLHLCTNESARLESVAGRNRSFPVLRPHAVDLLQTIDPIKLLSYLDTMRDHQQCGSFLSTSVPDEIDHVLLIRGIDIRGRFISQQ